MPWNGTKARQHNGKFQKRGIEHKIAETHMDALNRGLAAGMGSEMAHGMANMAVSDMMSPDKPKSGPTLVIIGKARNDGR
jgi:hypothetical protein